MLQRLWRPQSALRAACSLSKKPSTILPTIQNRNLHRIPRLTYGSSFQENGIPEFMSPETYDFAWTQYQSLLVEKINLLTQDTVDADAKPSDLIIKYARRPEMATLFNYVSSAHNNHFFFNCLSPEQVPIPEKFEATINDVCSSVESLKQDFLAAASAMFGPGYVWLAKSLEQEGRLHIFCTYNAGSPYPAAHARRQPIDMNTQSNDAHSDPMGSLYLSGGTRNPSLKSTAAPGSLQVNPILCVNTWEHVWLMDYGIAGKDEFLERWWNRINWDVVYDNYNLLTPKSVAGSLDRNPRVRF